MPEETSGFARFGSAQISAALLAFASWSDVANITFQRVQNGSSDFSNNATILLGNYNAGLPGAAAFAYLPGSTSHAARDGDVWINNSLNYNIIPTQQAFGQLTLVHEIGHAIGLGHPADYDAGDGGSITYAENAVYFEDSRQYTVMSYFSETATGADFGAGRYPSAALLDDISAAQRLYGSNMSTRTGDTVYGVNSNAGRPWFSTTGAVSGQLIFCAWDAGGIDTFNFSGHGGAQVIDLRQGAFSNVGGLVGNVSIAMGAVIENVIGGISSDDIRGNSADNHITSGGGTDTIDGGLGIDTVDFGDTYVMSVYTITWDGQVGTIRGGGHNVTVRNVEYLRFGNQTITATPTGGLIVAGDTTDETISGSSFGDTIGGLGGVDTINGLAGDDNLNGGSGNDTLNGGDDNDILIGALGNDTLNGGAGNDTADYSGAGASLTVNLSAGTAAGGAGLDTLTQVENVTGSVHADTLTGDGNANILRGGGGIDTLSGGGGDDHLFAGAPGEGGGAPDIVKTHLTMNNSIGNAVALTGGFDLGARADIANSGSIPHATVVATCHGGTEFYAFTVAAGETVVIDIDNASFDSVLRLYSAALLRLAQNDDSGSDGGAPTDSGLSHTFAAAGTYYVEVSRYLSGAQQDGNLQVTVPGPGATYTLHVSVPSAPAVPLEYVGSTLNGDSGADVLDGGTGRDTLNGGADDDVLAGRAGDDALDGGDGADTALFSGSRSAYTITVTGGVTTVAGPDGSDSLSNVEVLQFADGLYRSDGTPAGSIITGTSDADVLDGTSGVDSISGGHGDDVINPGAGNDTIDGGTGADTVVFSGNYGAYSISTSGGTTTVSGADGIDQLSNVERLRFVDGTYLVGAGGGQYFAGGAGADTISGTPFNDEMRGGSGNDTFISRGGADIIDGGAGEDTAIFAGHRSDFHIYMDSPGVTAVRLGPTGPLNLVTSVERIRFDDDFYGTNGSPLYRTASGTSGPEILVGHPGRDFISGLAGDDVIQGLGNSDLLDGGAGFDTAVFAGPRSNYVIAQEGSTTTLTYSDFLVRLLNIERLQFSDIATNILGEPFGGPMNGTPAADEVFGSAGDDVINGLAGDDMLYGQAGNDVLDGGAGQDALEGGDGIDTVSHASSTTGVEIYLDSQVTWDGVTTDNLSSIENAVGSGFADYIGGDAGANRLDGGVGDDVLDGGAGDDILVGGLTGLDHLRGGSGVDQITYAGHGTGVQVYLESQISWDGVTMDFLSSIENVIGTGHADYMAGDAAANRLEGGAGNDFLEGGGGDDILIGGLHGLDHMRGGAGVDQITYAGHAAGVQIYLDTEVTWDGVTMDFLSSIENAIGSSHADYMAGNAAANRLEGGAGDDFLEGGAGDDILIGGTSGLDHLRGGEGIDQITYAGHATGVQIYLDNQNSWDGVTMDFLSSIENVIGSSHADYMAGDAAANRLEGGGGDDLLDGGGGDDFLDGGASGLDTLRGGAGTDTVSYASSSTGMEIYLENQVSWDGTTVDILSSIENVIGSAQADYMAGDAGANRLEGGSGDDVVNGGAGSDIFVLRGLAADYTITAEGGGYRVTDAVTGRDGSDLLSGIETLRFSDGSTVTLPASAPAVPLVPPALASEKAAGPEVLPRADDDMARNDGPEVLPAVDDNFLGTGKFDLPPVMPPMIETDADPSFRTGLEQAREQMMALIRENPLNSFGDSQTLLDDWSGVAPPSRGEVWD